MPERTPPAAYGLDPRPGNSSRGGDPSSRRHLLIHEGLSIVEMARRAGHSPQTCLDTYSHVFDDFAPERRVDSEAVIRAARDELVRVRFASDEATR